MKDNRKSIKVPPGLKTVIEGIRKEIDFKNEAQALAYLCAMYSDQKGKRITLAEHQRYVKEAEEMLNQVTL